MKVRQYVYFSLDSERVSAAEITALVGVEADRFMVKGSRDGVRVIPRTHAWQMRARQTNKRIDDQIGELLERLAGITDKIEMIVSDLPVQASLRVVRIFDDPEGEEDEGTTPEMAAAGFEKVGGQHHLLGWHVGRDLVAFLDRTRTELEVDEYG